ncbi:pseudouridine synthase [Rubrobacter calidifluminis]|uniref:pseudouridine synthase n=1 Tax=Rubrobacter calidifluminis TaxID=1392640 RepID=UPI002362E5E3|nr:pseudouridine synthase [Rubrobacter calidifluminis]
MRLQAYLARSGAAPSRRKAEALIREGRVQVNGSVAPLGMKISPGDTVLLDGRPVHLPETRAYLALNKPAGYITTLSDERGRPTVAELVPSIPGLVPVGRLDADTTGLIVMTNDGRLAHRVAHPSYEIEKEYRLTLQNPVPKDALHALAAGPDLEDGPMAPPVISRLHRGRHRTVLHLTIHEGRKRIIRRACQAVGLHLVHLERVRVGPVRLGDLAPGEYRRLTGEEVEELWRGR